MLRYCAENNQPAPRPKVVPVVILCDTAVHRQSTDDRDKKGGQWPPFMYLSGVAFSSPRQDKRRLMQPGDEAGHGLDFFIRKLGSNHLHGA